MSPLKDLSVAVTVVAVCPQILGYSALQDVQLKYGLDLVTLS